ncbi:MAG: aminotransferase class V-fold PLP-dependent enzyme, partial [Bacteroidetes bacterium]|nr:aminotransferase class V-fold PLP-dependent enzyme [Bacteroidota bacterium]
MTSQPDIGTLRSQFPALQTEVHGKEVAYLDNAATAQKPLAVLERMEQYYRRENANVHRGVHTMSQVATDAYEGARSRMASFLGASDPREIIFTRGTTEAINLVANTFGLGFSSGDEILISEME